VPKNVEISRFCGERLWKMWKSGVLSGFFGALRGFSVENSVDMWKSIGNHTRPAVYYYFNTGIYT
jgi:hypothetical protein